METRNLKSMARETAELALQLAGLPTDGRTEAQALYDIEQLASRIMKEAATARNAAVRPVGESRGIWRVMQPAR
jgi:hypothetical protein